MVILVAQFSPTSFGGGVFRRQRVCCVVSRLVSLTFKSQGFTCRARIVIKKTFFQELPASKQRNSLSSAFSSSQARTCGENVANELQQRLFRQPCFSHIARAAFSQLSGSMSWKITPESMSSVFFEKLWDFSGKLLFSTHTSERTPRKGGRQFNILFSSETNASPSPARKITWKSNNNNKNLMFFLRKMFRYGKLFSQHFRPPRTRREIACMRSKVVPFSRWRSGGRGTRAKRKAKLFVALEKSIFVH